MLPSGYGRKGSVTVECLAVGVVEQHLVTLEYRYRYIEGVTTFRAFLRPATATPMGAAP
jgi:hypothetical protein